MLNMTAQTAGLGAMKPLEAFGPRLPNAQANVLNRVLTRTKSALIPALVHQTGLSKRIITKAIRTARASPSNPRVMLITRGGEVSFRYFGAREVSGGVEATVKGKKDFVAGGFRRSGPTGRRAMVTKLNGQVYVNVDGGRWHGHIQKEKSGVFIPTEFVTGETARTFYGIVDSDLAVEVECELVRLLGPGGR